MFLAVQWLDFHHSTTKQRACRVPAGLIRSRGLGQHLLHLLGLARSHGFGGQGPHRHLHRLQDVEDPVLAALLLVFVGFQKTTLDSEVETKPIQTNDYLITDCESSAILAGCLKRNYIWTFGTGKLLLFKLGVFLNPFPSL